MSLQSRKFEIYHWRAEQIPQRIFDNLYEIVSPNGRIFAVSYEQALCNGHFTVYLAVHRMTRDRSLSKFDNNIFFSLPLYLTSSRVENLPMLKRVCRWTRWYPRRDYKSILMSTFCLLLKFNCFKPFPLFTFIKNQPLRRCICEEVLGSHFKIIFELYGRTSKIASQLSFWAHTFALWSQTLPYCLNLLSKLRSQPPFWNNRCT